MTKKSLEILRNLFAENSNLQMPVSLIQEVLEIRTWVAEELKKHQDAITDESSSDVAQDTVIV